jgi:hypothetical protein
MDRWGWGRVVVAAFASMLVIAAAGAGTKVVETKGEKGSKLPPPKKVLVVVVSPNAAMRAAFEEVIAGELSLRGTPAVGSHLLFPELPKERGPLEERLKSEGFDAVTISRLVGKADKVEWKEATAVYDANYAGQDYWGGYWYTYNQAILPGYLEHELRVRVRTDLWRATGEKTGPVWSGTSELIDPVTLAEVAREVAVSIVKAMSKAKVI